MGLEYLPKPGDRYKSPSAGYGLSPKNRGPYYNISVTLDREALDIVHGWPKGTKSERIRWAIKDRHYGNSPEVTEYIETLLNSISRLQDRLGTEIMKNEINPKRQSVLSALVRALRRVANRLGMRRGND